VILDNAGQLYGGGENDRHTVTAFLNTLSGALYGRAILLLAHPSRTAGSEFSGSSAWENVARTRLYLGATLPGEKPDPEATPEDNVRYLARRKANYSSKDWRKFTFEDGALRQDENDSGSGDGILGHIREQAAERIVLEGLKRLAELGLAPTESPTSRRYLPRLLHDYKLAEGHTRDTLADAIRRLMLAGRLRRAQVGKDDYRRPMWGLEAQ
jgi:hypothetical protein